jgi:hypothetical protein
MHGRLAFQKMTLPNIMSARLSWRMPQQSDCHRPLTARYFLEGRFDFGSLQSSRLEVAEAKGIPITDKRE